MAIERALGAKSKGSVWPAFIAWPLTMVLVMIGWVMFRANTVADAFIMYAGMAGTNGFAMRPENVTLLKPTEVLLLAVGVVLAIAPRLEWRSVVGGQLRTAGTAALFAVCFVAIQARTESPFLYFQF